MVLKNRNCLELLKNGYPPVFRIVPAFRPYKFDDSTIKTRTAESTITFTKSLKDIIEAQRKNEARFFTMINSVTENFNISPVKMLNYEIENEEKSNQSHENRYLFLDGANDSDDEENYKSKLTGKRWKTTYPSLPISKNSSSTPAGVPNAVNKQTDSKKGVNDESTIKFHPNQSAICDNIEKIKRRINFNYNTIECTLIEEQTECKTKVSNIHETLVVNKILGSEIVNNKLSKTSQQISRSVEAFDISKHDITLEQKEKKYRVPTSTLYDIINNYHPEEGTSKCWNEQIHEYSGATSCSSSQNFPSNFGTLKQQDGESSLQMDFDESSTKIQPYSNMLADENIHSVPFQYLKSKETECAPSINEDLWPSSGSSLGIPCAQREIRTEVDKKSESCSSTPSNIFYYKPQFKAPTRDDVEESMASYGIPKLKPQEPFYGNPEDATKSLEVGYNTLKIKSLTSVDMPDFESNFLGLDVFRKDNFPDYLPKSSKTNVNPRYFYCGNRVNVLTPVNKPPTRKEVEDWLKRQQSSVTEVVDEPAPKKKKIFFRCSQDGGSDDDSLDLSLTLTPLTPKSVTCSPVLRISGTESKEDSDVSSLKDGYLDKDVNLTPKSAKSGTRKTRNKKLNKSVFLRKSALLSNLNENSGVISGINLDNTYGFKNTLQNYQNARASIEHEYLTIFSMEVHVNTRGDFKPNPQYDPIEAIFYQIWNDVDDNDKKPKRSLGVFTVNNTTSDEEKTKSSILYGLGLTCDVKYFESELELFREFSKFVISWDPDILIGYEIQTLSWGYLIERCFNLGINILPEISRVKDKHLRFNDKETGDLRVTGRVVLDFWRLLRHEIALQSYTLQSTVYEILQKRIPKYSFKELTFWWKHNTNKYRHRVVKYYLTCVGCVLNIMEQLDFVGRTSELARLFGIQFYEVLSRGSQFRVESMMLRLAKPLNYVAVSPSVQQRAKMRAPEHIALVLEPESKLYNDPVIVLDFQSLYPSIIIAYNYCFSTCVGRVELLGKNSPFEFGATNLKISKDRINHFLRRNLLNFSPCGVGFVKKSVRDGIMPRMLREILDTRLMVKKAMKENKNDSLLQKVLHNRQLGLKLIANVTYGYTAANFSGKMPNVELGDSIVSKARETLQRAIALVDGNEEWGVRVVYGDTDSLFVHCPGKSRKEAFEIGEEIVMAVGKENPDPVKLKLEKVYQPCILQTKKRYVGYMYEGPDQEEPVYEAKGIETVRRDGCPAVSKMLEKTLRILFETKDVSKVKKYCLSQFNKIIMGRVSIQDLTFAKEFRGITGYRPGACVPSLELAKKWIATDKRAEPRRGERVPYVIINGPPGYPLIRLVRSPYEVLSDSALRPNALYYITRVIIPPLNRCFNLIGADVHHWFLQMPRKQLQYLPTVNSPTKKSTISQYFATTLCAVCGVHTQNGLCETCRKKPQESVVILNEKVRVWESSYNICKMICSSCTQIPDEPKCISLDCPVLYRLHQTNRDLQQADHIRMLLHQNFDIF